MPEKSSLPTPDDQKYSAMLNGLKVRICSAQFKAAIAVNQELIFLYWQIGREILARQKAEGWGKSHYSSGQRPKTKVPQYERILGSQSRLHEISS